jgi:FAD/FMN-containing dehydrogenase
VRVDAERRIIHAEAGVTMETLVRTAREYGLVPKVVAPFRKATVGGAVSAAH